MFGEKAFELIKELDRNPDNLPPFNVSTQTHVAIAIFTLLVIEWVVDCILCNL